MARRFATLTEQLHIRELLQVNLARTDQLDKDGVPVWKYLNGFTDQKIAEVVSADLRAHHVLSVRTELFGPVKGAEAPPPRPTSNVPGRLGTLESRVANMERLIHYLCESLGVPCDPNTGT